MDDILAHSPDDQSNHTRPNKQDELVDALKKQAEAMKHDIGIFTRLAEYYYGTDGTREYSAYTGEEADIGNDAHLYTLIKYDGKDILVQIGAGEFNTEVFTRRNIPELKGFSYGPLPLFVVTSRADQEFKEKNPRKFLNEHTIIYSPKGGQAQLRTDSDIPPINYGESNGILNYPDAHLALQNAQIHKSFPTSTSFAKSLDKMKELHEKTPEELQKRTTLKEEYFEKEDRVIYAKTLECLRRLSDGNQENLYGLIQSFDLHKGVFSKLPI